MDTLEKPPLTTKTLSELRIDAAYKAGEMYALKWSSKGRAKLSDKALVVVSRLELPAWNLSLRGSKQEERDLIQSFGFGACSVFGRPFDVRALDPEPKAQTNYRGAQAKLDEAHMAEVAAQDAIVEATSNRMRRANRDFQQRESLLRSEAKRQSDVTGIPLPVVLEKMKADFKAAKEKHIDRIRKSDDEMEQQPSLLKENPTEGFKPVNQIAKPRATRAERVSVGESIATEQTMISFFDAITPAVSKNQGISLC